MQGSGGDWPRRNTPHRKPPCEELDPAAISPQTPLGELVAPPGTLAISGPISKGRDRREGDGKGGESGKGAGREGVHPSPRKKKKSAPMISIKHQTQCIS